MWDPREPPTWWIAGLVLVVLGAIAYITTGLPRWMPWIPLGLGFLFFIVGMRVRTRHGPEQR